MSLKKLHFRFPKSYSPTPPSKKVQRILAGGRAYVMLLGDDGGSQAADVDDNATLVLELLFDATSSKGSTTIRA